MFISDANFGLVLFTLHVHSTINYNDKIDCFTISERDRSNWFETILQYYNTFCIELQRFKSPMQNL